MSGAIPLAIELLIELVPLVKTVVAQAKSGIPPTADQEAALDATLDKVDAIIQAS